VALFVGGNGSTETLQYICLCTPWQGARCCRVRRPWRAPGS
jgi:hypothetical protein